MSGIRPAAEMIFAACAVIMNLRNLTASGWCFEYFVTEKPSPGYWTTPCCLPSAYGGTKAPRLFPSPFCRVEVSQLPSTIIAAWPLTNAPRMFVFVSTSLFVQPLFGSPTHLVICETIFGDVQGVLPV